MAGTVRIAILADAKGVKSGVRDASSVLDNFKTKASRTGDVMKGVLGANIIGAGVSAVASGLGVVKDKFGEAVDAASALQQSTGAVDAVFGRSASVIKKSATSAAQSLGLSRNAYQELASTLGAGLKNQGIKDFAGQTQNVIKLGGDLAAQFGGSTSDAVEAIGSLMRGEADPIEKYGVSIKQSAINAELAAKGQTKLTGAAKTQAEAQARLGLLFKQTKDAQGAFAREGESLANIQQRNAAATENLKAKFGTVFLPIMTQVQNVIANQVLPAFERFLPVITKLGAQIGPAFTAASTALAPLIAQVQGFFSGKGGFDPAAFIAKITPIKDGLVTVFTSLKTVFLTVAPIVLSVISTLVAAYQANAPKIGAALQTLASIVTEVAGIISSVWTRIGPVILPVLTAVFGAVVSIIGGALNVVLAIVRTVGAALRGDWRGVWAGLNGIVMAQFNLVKSIVLGAFNVIKTLFSRLGASLKAQWGGTWNTIKSVVSIAWNTIKAVVSNAANAVRSAVVSRISAIRSTMASTWSSITSTVTSAWSRIKAAVTSGITTVVSTIRSLPGKARAALGGIGSALYSAGGDLVRGFANGISGSLGFIAERARSIASTAINAAKSALGIASPSKVFKSIGAFVGKGFIIGLKGTESQVKSAVNRMVGYLQREAKTKGKAGKRARTALRIVNALDNRAVAIAKAKTVATTKLAAAQAKVNDLIKARNDYAAGVKDSATSFASIVGIKLEDDLPLTNATLIQGLKERLAAIVNFKAKLAQLKQQGLNATSLQQIIAAGVEGGTEVANTLATGGATVIKSINSLQGQINAQATSLGNTTAGYFYATGIAAQQGLIKGLLADKKKLESAAASIAKTLSDAVKRALKIKSPSRVFRGIGDNVTKGLTIGLDSKATKRAGAVLAGSLVSGFGSPTLGAQALAAAASGGDTYLTVNLQVAAGASKSEIGREFVGFIKEYEKTSGRKVLVK